MPPSDRSTSLLQGDGLDALRAFGRTLFAANPCMHVSADVIWSADEAPRDDELVARAAVLRAPLDALQLEGQPDPPGIVRCDSDWYFCAGAETLGSGRAVIVDHWQVKGVGRTVQAPLSGDASSTDGYVVPARGLDEVACAMLVARLLSTPLHSPIALLFPESPVLPSDVFLLVRESIPLRVAHLAFLAGAGHRMRPAQRMLSWRNLCKLAFLGGSGQELTSGIMHQVFQAMVERALVMTAEARIFGLVLSNFFDNGDIRGHVFDFEDFGFRFGKKWKPPEHASWLVRDESPAEYFSRLGPSGSADVNGSSLLPVTNAFLSMDIIADGVGWEGAPPSNAWTWPALIGFYKAAMQAAMLRICGLSDPGSHGPQCAEGITRLVDHMPLALHGSVQPFSVATMLEQFARACRGKRVSPGAEAEVARALVDAATCARAHLESLAVRAEATCEALDGTVLEEMRARFKRDATAVATAKQGDRAARRASYQALMASFEAEIRARALPLCEPARASAPVRAHREHAATDREAGSRTGARQG